MSKDRFLVTGGAGFIGSNIVEELLKRGHDVAVFDNMSTGRKRNLDAFLKDIELITADLRDVEAVRKAVKGRTFVLHQGALPSVSRSVQDPVASNDTNISGTLNILLAARDEGVHRVVMASSSSVYGDTPTLPKVETMAVLPMSPYAVTKLAGEKYCAAFYKVYGFEAVALRYFNVFGPRQDPTSQYSAVIPRFITAVIKGQQPVIYGDGEQSRDFTFVANTVDANIRACYAKDVAGDFFNVACGERFSLLDLLREIGLALGLDATARHEAGRAGDVKHSLADISKIKRAMGYEPSVSFREGLTRTVAYFSQEVFMNVPMLNLPAQYQKIKTEVMAEINEIFETQYFILGPRVKKIESMMAELAGMKCGIGASSGTDALILALMATEPHAGDEVITTPYTFFATAEAIVRTGSRPIFVDIEEDSFNQDLAQTEAAISRRTRALLPVHLFGLVIDPIAWRGLAEKYKLWLVEDACQAVGAKRKGMVAGGIGDLSAFSFYPTKNIGGAGDGGMVLARDDKLGDTVRMDRMHGGRDRYFYDRIGVCARLDEIQAAVLMVKFKHLHDWNEHRRKMAALYTNLLKGAPVRMQAVPDDAYHTFHQYVIRVPRRDELKDFLKDRGIASDIYYPVPLHLQPCFSYLGYKKGQFPVAEQLALDSLALPINAEISEEQVEAVAKGIHDFYGGAGA